MGNDVVCQNSTLQFLDEQVTVRVANDGSIDANDGGCMFFVPAVADATPSAAERRCLFVRHAETSGHHCLFTYLQLWGESFSYVHRAASDRD